MGLVRDIQKAAISSDVGLPQLLRMAKVLASRLGNDEFKKWVDNELNGYASTADLPPYRILGWVESRGSLSGYFGRDSRNIPLPTVNLPDWVQKELSTLPLASGVSEYESLAKRFHNASQPLQVDWPANWIAAFQDKFYTYMSLYAAWRVVPVSLIEMLLDTVRTRLLDFVLALDEATNNLESIDEGHSVIPAENVSQAFYTTIYGGTNTVAAGSQDFTQNIQQTQITTGDFESLRRFLESTGLQADDLNELEEAVKADDPPEKAGTFGSKVSGWIAKMTGKAASGVWSVGLSVAGSLLSKALADYYGLK